MTRPTMDFTIVIGDFDVGIRGCLDGSGGDSTYPVKDSGAQSTPRSKEREKFRVARAERKRPSRRREEDLTRKNCCGVGFARRVRTTAIMSGMRTFAMAKMCAAGARCC